MVLEPKGDEVRWSMHVLRTLTNIWIQKLSSATTPVEKQVVVWEPKGEEVRWSVYVLLTLTNIWNQKLSENSRSVVPTTTEYITATGKQALELLQSAAKVLPVPYLQSAIGVALKIIEVCEVCRIPPRENCETTHDMLFSGCISRRRKGQGSTRQSMPFDGCYCGERNVQK